MASCIQNICHTAAMRVLRYCLLLLTTTSIGNAIETATGLQLPDCELFLAPSTIPGTGWGLFAGRAFNATDYMFSSWSTLFFPYSLPPSLLPWYYVFGVNDTHVALPLSYGSIANHHDLSNAANVWTDYSETNIGFQATKYIPAGQEIFVSYGDSLEWFENKGLSYKNIDYADTMWRPDRTPLPCRQPVAQRTDGDGKLFQMVLEDVQEGEILDITVALPIPVHVVESLSLWQFVLADPREDQGGDAQSVLIPLSYAAHIPTTQDPTLANVRVAMSSTNSEVRGSTSVMLTLSATRDLRDGDVLLRFDPTPVRPPASRDVATRPRPREPFMNAKPRVKHEDESENINDDDITERIVVDTHQSKDETENINDDDVTEHIVDPHQEL